MSFIETLRIGYRALGANRLRSLLTVLGIVVGVAAVVCMVSVGLGARAAVAEKLRTLGANLLVIKPGAQNSGGVRRAAGTQRTLSVQDASAVARELPDVVVAAPLVSRPMQVVAGDHNWSTLVAGIGGGYLFARDWQLAEGRSFAAADLDSGAQVAIIGADVERQLFAGRSGFGGTIRIGSVPLTVVGVLRRKGQGAAGRSQDDVVFVPLSTATSRLLGTVHGDRRGALDFILVKVRTARVIPKVIGQIGVLLRARHHLPDQAADDFTIENPADVLVARQQAVRTLGYLLLSVALVALAVGGISVMNIMLVVVTERTREVGLRIALGARRRDIRLQFLAEAAMLALVGGALGVIFGCAVAVAIAWRAGWPVLLSATAVMLAWGLAGLVGICFGLYPAHRAARLDAMTALRFE